MSGQAYQGCGQRTFRQALISMLEKDYRLLGSRRVLALLAEDIESMVNEFSKNLGVAFQILNDLKDWEAAINHYLKTGEKQEHH